MHVIYHGSRPNVDMERQTKIVCTIGPASSSETELQALIEAGMNVARLNFAHGDHTQHGAVLARIRVLSERLEVPVAVLQDLAGPKVRIGTVAGGSIMLEAGHPLILATTPLEGSPVRVSVSYANLPREVEEGDVLFLADGTIQLGVERVTEAETHCRVVVGGRLGSRKGVNVPSGLSGLPVLGGKDLQDNSWQSQGRRLLVLLTMVRVGGGKSINGTTTSYLYDQLNPVQEQYPGSVANLLVGLTSDEFFTRTHLGNVQAFSWMPLVQRWPSLTLTQWCRPPMRMNRSAQRQFQGSPRTKRGIAGQLLRGEDGLLGRPKGFLMFVRGLIELVVLRAKDKYSEKATLWAG